MVTVGLVAWLVRIVFPVGVGLPVVGFQLAHFPQYIFAYSIGILISKNNWLENIKKNTAKILLWLMPLILSFGIGVALVYTKFGDAQLTMGGFNLVALLYAIWEQCMFIVMSVGLISVFKNKYNNQNKGFVLKYMSDNAFHAYIIHFLVIVMVVIVLSHFNLAHFIGMLLATFLSISISFLLGSIVKKAPGL